MPNVCTSEKSILKKARWGRKTYFLRSGIKLYPISPPETTPTRRVKFNIYVARGKKDFELCTLEIILRK
jgi:hypothetical protein